MQQKEHLPYNSHWRFHKWNVVGNYTLCFREASVVQNNCFSSQ